MLALEHQAIIVAFRRHTLLPLDDCSLRAAGNHPHLPAPHCIAVCNRLTKPRHPWTSGQVERMSRIIKEGTVKRYHYDSHDQLRGHLQDLVSAYNFGLRLKTLTGLTLYKSIYKARIDQPTRFRLDSLHQMPGLNI